jgi:mRNA-degrading endonuclease RelE of RelBE toxin-antitoxin system
MLDCKKLSGTKDMYRIRVGKFRIKFQVHSTFNEIKEIVRRGDNTY